MPVRVATSFSERYFLGSMACLSIKCRVYVRYHTRLHAEKNRKMHCRLFVYLKSILMTIFDEKFLEAREYVGVFCLINLQFEYRSHFSRRVLPILLTSVGYAH